MITTPRSVLALALGLGLSLGVVPASPAFADSIQPEPPVATGFKARVRRACEAGLDRVERATDKVRELQTDFYFAILRSMMSENGKLHRASAWVDRQIEKVPEGVRRHFRLTLEDQQRIVVYDQWLLLASHRVTWAATLATSQAIDFSIRAISETLTGRPSRIAHNTRALMLAAFPGVEGADQRPDAGVAMERLIDQTPGRYAYPVLTDTYLFVKGRRRLRHFAAGSEVVLEDGLVVSWSK